MKEINFEGYSDDVLCVGGFFSDEVGCFDKMLSIGLSSAATQEQINVVAQYAPTVVGKVSGCWVIGIQNADEGETIPAWKFAYSQGDCEYSPKLTIMVPDDTEIHLPTD